MAETQRAHIDGSEDEATRGRSVDNGDGGVADAAATEAGDAGSIALPSIWFVFGYVCRSCVARALVSCNSSSHPFGAHNF